MPHQVIRSLSQSLSHFAVISAVVNILFWAGAFVLEKRPIFVSFCALVYWNFLASGFCAG